LDVGMLGGITVHCFFILPTTVLRIWRMKYWGDAVVLFRYYLSSADSKSPSFCVPHYMYVYQPVVSHLNVHSLAPDVVRTFASTLWYFFLKWNDVLPICSALLY
jgi:hypothetical protein